MYVCSCIYTHKVHMYVCVCVCVCIKINMYTYIYTHMYTYTYVYAGLRAKTCTILRECKSADTCTITGGVGALNRCRYNLLVVHTCLYNRHSFLHEAHTYKHTQTLYVCNIRVHVCIYMYVCTYSDLAPFHTQEYNHNKME